MNNKQQFQISGTHCPACKRLIERRISEVNGVTEVDVDFETGKTEISATRALLKDEIQKALEGMEYKVI